MIGTSRKIYMILSTVCLYFIYNIKRSNFKFFLIASDILYLEPEFHIQQDHNFSTNKSTRSREVSLCLSSLCSVPFLYKLKACLHQHEPHINMLYILPILAQASSYLGKPSEKYQPYLHFRWAELYQASQYHHWKSLHSDFPTKIMSMTWKCSMISWKWP